MLCLLPCATANIVSLAMKADLSGIIIIAILFGGSIWVWSMMVSKYISLKNAENESLAFLRRYRGVSHPMALFMKDSTFRGRSPLQEVYDQACVSMEAVLAVQGIEIEDLFAEGTLSRVPLSDRQIRSVQNAAERMVTDQALLLETGMGYLASASSTAPFLGLLGTVWGVMNSFGSMAGSGSALLSDVAPGISSALITTVVGLVVALPSSLGYNMLSDRIRRLTVMMDNFSQELVGDLERVHLS